MNAICLTSLKKVPLQKLSNQPKTRAAEPVASQKVVARRQSRKSSKRRSLLSNSPNVGLVCDLRKLARRQNKPSRTYHPDEPIPQSQLSTQKRGSKKPAQKSVKRPDAQVDTLSSTLAVGATLLTLYGCMVLAMTL